MNIEILLTDFLYCISSILIIAVGKNLVEFLKAKSIQTNNKVLDLYIAQLQEITANVVVFVNQTYVEDLKKTNKFGKDEKNKAFKLAKDTILDLVDEDILSLLKETSVDTLNYLDILIESAVNNAKGGSK